MKTLGSIYLINNERPEGFSWDKKYFWYEPFGTVGVVKEKS